MAITRVHSIHRLTSPLLLLLAPLLSACDGGGPTGLAAAGCGPGPHFTTLPVALNDILGIVVIGGLGAPGHVLPTAHAGFALRTVGAQLVAPGNIQITRIRRVRYVTSPVRQGVEDFATEFSVCEDVSGWFGHVTSLASSITVPQSAYRDCDTYSTPTETVETCAAEVNIRLSAGQPLGTGGHSIALGLMGLDFGMRDRRVNNFYVTRSRFNMDMFQSICPWEQFESSIKAQLYTKLSDPSRGSMAPAGEPRCGTMEVDVANTAKGVWILTGTQTVPGNETNFITLANYPYRPQEYLALSLGPTNLGARVAVVSRLNSGRVNRAFEQVTNDGLVYCYGPDTTTPTSSWFLSMNGATGLRVRQVTHAFGASPCSSNPTTWSMTGAVSLDR